MQISKIVGFKKLSMVFIRYLWILILNYFSLRPEGLKKDRKKVPLNGDHYIWRYVFFWCLPLGQIILHWSHEKIVLFGSNFLMLYSSWAIGANFLVYILWWSWIPMKDATLLYLMSHIVSSMRMFKDCRHKNCSRGSFFASPLRYLGENIFCF